MMLTQQHVCGLSTAIPPRLTSRASLRGARAVAPSKTFVSRRGRAKAVVVKGEPFREAPPRLRPVSRSVRWMFLPPIVQKEPLAEN